MVSMTFPALLLLTLSAAAQSGEKQGAAPIAWPHSRVQTPTGSGPWSFGIAHVDADGRVQVPETATLGSLSLPCATAIFRAQGVHCAVAVQRHGAQLHIAHASGPAGTPTNVDVSGIALPAADKGVFFDATGAGATTLAVAALDRESGCVHVRTFAVDARRARMTPRAQFLAEDLCVALERFHYGTTRWASLVENWDVIPSGRALAIESAELDGRAPRELVVSAVLDGGRIGVLALREQGAGLSVIASTAVTIEKGFGYGGSLDLCAADHDKDGRDELALVAPLWKKKAYGSEKSLTIEWATRLRVLAMKQEGATPELRELPSDIRPLGGKEAWARDAYGIGTPSASNHRWNPVLRLLAANFVGDSKHEILVAANGKLGNGYASLLSLQITADRVGVAQGTPIDFRGPKNGACFKRFDVAALPAAAGRSIPIFAAFFGYDEVYSSSGQAVRFTSFDASTKNTRTHEEGWPLSIPVPLVLGRIMPCIYGGAK